MSLLRSLTAGVLLLAVSSSALEPHNGTVGTLDFRYPNYIVKPLVRCPYEGYFPHPRDNTWFYRCYRRYDSSFFWRAYFQCPPCTVFSGALDQCVFQETGTHCPPHAELCRETFEDCRLVRICVAPNSDRAVISATEVCFKTTFQCPGQPDKPMCQEGYVFDRTNGQCRLDTSNLLCLPDPAPKPKPFTTTSPPTTTPTELEPCLPPGYRPGAEDYQALGCSQRQFCDSNGHPLPPILGCEFYWKCEFTAPGRRQLVRSQCPERQLFFYGRVNQCSGKGRHDLYNCHQSATTTTTTTTQAPSKYCTFVSKTLFVPEGDAPTYCRRSCGDSGKTQDSNRYCDNYFEVDICWKGNIPVLSLDKKKLLKCEPGHWFDVQIKACLPITDICRRKKNSSNAMRQTPDLFTQHTSVRLNQVNPYQPAPQLPYTSTQVLDAAPLQHPTG